MFDSRWTCACAVAALAIGATAAQAATLYVAAGGDLQQALDAAQPGDTVLLQEGAEFVGNFVLPFKTGSGWITVRTSAPDSVLPPAGVRIRPSDAPLLARLRSPNGSPALMTGVAAHHWVLAYLEFGGNAGGQGEILRLGESSSLQDTLAEVPQHFSLHHLYVHGDPLEGQKRGIALNAGNVTITDSHVSECKGIGQDTQAIAGWNGPGPFLIENNYLEAAGENVMFGGADPAIPDLVADGITFRRNYVSRPMGWRDPIVPAPQGLTASAEPGGSLVAGVYAYRVVARRPVYGGIMARSTASAEAGVSAASAAGAVRLRWAAVPGATEYRVYGRTAGAQAAYWTVTGTEFVDTGAAGTAEAVPTGAGTMWSVKNLFELKNARNVLVAANIFENHWRESQAGFAVVLTPRNSNGACTWCVVENVTFEYNIVRNVAAGVNILGYDIPSRPTRQTVNLTFRHNVFQGITTALGGNAWFMQIGDEPRAILLDHNTVDSNGGSLIYVYGGTSTDPREVYGFEMIANAARHNSYGIFGQTFSYGNAILAGYFPDAIVSNNYLAGAPLSRYPAGTLAAGDFAAQFADIAAGDFTLRGDSILAGAAADGSDVGADFAEVAARTAGVTAGSLAGTVPPAPPTAQFTASCDSLQCTFEDTSVPGSAPIGTREWTFGDAGQSAGTPATHAFASPGSYTVTLTVTDANGLSAGTSQVVTVTAANAVHAEIANGAVRTWTTSKGVTYWSATVKVIAHTSGEAAVPGATVTIEWSGGIARTATCTTGSKGACTFKSGRLGAAKASVTATVRNVAAPGSPYDPGANHDGSGTATSTVTLLRP
jgi:PKD repeat protein